MNSRSFTGYMLMGGPIITVLIFIVWSITIGNYDLGSSSETYLALGAEYSMVKTLTALWFLTFMMMLVGLRGVQQSMESGSGAHFAMAGFIVLVVGMTMGLSQGAINVGLAKAGEGIIALKPAVAAGLAPAAVLAGATQTAETLFAVTSSLDGFGQYLQYMGFAMLGIGFCIQKTFAKAVCGLVVVMGVLGVILVLIDNTASITLVPFLGMLLMNTVMGFSFMKAKG
jgi:hypothetical protein